MFRLRITVFLLAASAILTLPMHAVAADAKMAAPYKGKFVSYDPERKTLRVAGSRAEATFAVDPNVKITVDDNRPTDRKLADLPNDSFLILTLNEDRSTVVAANAIGPMRQVTIESIDVEKRTMTVRDKKKNIEKYEFAKDVLVTNDKTPGTLADLKPGGRLQVKVSVDKSRAMSIRLLATKS